jgi:hypothetical protein
VGRSRSVRRSERRDRLSRAAPRGASARSAAPPRRDPPSGRLLRR